MGWIFLIGIVAFGIYKIWKYFDNKQWDKRAREKIETATNKAKSVEANSMSNQGRDRAKLALETADVARGLFAYEAYNLAEEALRFAEEAENFSKMTDDKILKMNMENAEIVRQLVEKMNTENAKLVGKWENNFGHIINTYEFTNDSKFSYSSIGQKNNGGSGTYKISGGSLIINLNSAYGPDSHVVTLHRDIEKSIDFESGGINIDGRFFTRM